MAKHKKVHHEYVDKHFVTKRTRAAMGMGYEVPKYVQFIDKMLNIGYRVKLHEAFETRSKYVTVEGGHDLQFKVRFSNHKPIKARELAGDCDFFVGMTHTGTRTTNMAVEAVREFFNAV